ncbi:DUF2254 domain-containing protein [Prescottella equi]|uniref:DUF2254 domain-containing protein n=1 Tax=Rhodococcus hoagii TaxID=43767 RepID=UPI000AE45B8A|nr:DUF2254 domain-containing protein [Prescottella equi]
MRNDTRASRRRDVVFDALRTRLWPVPTLGVIVAIGVGIGTVQLDEALDGSMPPWLSQLLFGGGPDAAREVLGSVAGSLITVTSLTFSLTLVTLQLASSQFSPRLLRTFARDRFVQRTLALFLATFVYSLTVLRTVRTGTDGGDSEFVPKISVTTAFLLAVASVIALVLFLAHLVREIRVETMLANVYRDAAEAVRAAAPKYDPQAPPPAVPRRPTRAYTVDATSSGFVTRVDEAALLTAAIEMNVVITIDRMPGRSVTEGTPVASVWSHDPGAEIGSDDLRDLRSRTAAAIRTGPERTPIQDLGYGLQQLTDVVVKALSPGINDPTTAIHALGHSSALLCEMATLDLSPRTLCDERGHTLVVIPRPSLAMLLDWAVTQPRRYGASDASVLARLFLLLQELAWHAPWPDRELAITSQLARLQVTVSAQSFDLHESHELEQSADAVVDALRGRWATDT